MELLFSEDEMVDDGGETEAGAGAVRALIADEF